MKKFQILKLFVLVGILATALVFVGMNFVQAQSQAKGKPDKPPGKPEPDEPPKVTCNNNGVCEYGEYDSKSDPEDQPCSDCLPKIYPPLEIDQTGVQIACAGSSFLYSSGKVYQFKYLNGEYKDTWASDDIGIYGRVVSIGDADNDGEKEIIAIVSDKVRGRKYDQRIFMYKTGSDGSPSWISPYFGNPSTEKIRDCVIGDVDGDGENEVTLIKGQHIEIYRINYNQGDVFFSFSHVWTSPEHESRILHNVYGLDVGDADNDGKNEIVLAMFETGAPIIWKKENGTWNSKTAELIPIEECPLGWLGIDVVKVRDVDNVINGYGELDNEIIAGGNNNRLMVWKYNEDTGNYDSVFISEDLIGLTQGVDAGDIDGDGANEIAVAASYDNNTLYIFKYIGGNYINANSIQRDSGNIGLAVGNLDYDGKAEIVSVTLGITIYDFIGDDIFLGYLVKTYNCPYGLFLEID